MACKWRCNGAGSVDLDRQSYHLYLDRVDVLLRGGVRDRCYGGHINNWEAEALGGGFINACACRSCVDQGKTRLRCWKNLALL